MKKIYPADFFRGIHHIHKWRTSVKQWDQVHASEAYEARKQRKTMQQCLISFACMHSVPLFLCVSVKPVSQSCAIRRSGLFRGNTSCKVEIFLKYDRNRSIIIHFKQYVHSFIQSAMFTGRLARQTNRLYVLRMTVKLASWL